MLACADMGMIRVSAASEAAIRARAVAEGRSLVAVVDRLVSTEAVHSRSWPTSPPAISAGAPALDPAAAAAAICRRCQHETRKHDPHCYVAGCACRRLMA